MEAVKAGHLGSNPVNSWHIIAEEIDSLLLVKDIQRCSHACNSSIMCAMDKDPGWVRVPKIGFMLHLPSHIGK